MPLVRATTALKILGVALSFSASSSGSSVAATIKSLVR